MSGKAKDRGLWLTLAALAVLLVVLAAMQYRWSGEIGRAEAERRQAHLERAAWRFANAFEREMGQVLKAFHVDPGATPADRRAFLVGRLAAWRREEHAALLSNLLLATRSPSGTVALEACGVGQDAFRKFPWTPDLDPLRERLQTNGRGRDGLFRRPLSLLDRPLALSLPIVEIGNDGPPGDPWGRFRLAGMILLRLDEDYLRRQLLPQLAETHFGPPAESDFVAVVRRTDRSVIFSSDPGVTALAPQAGDVVRSLPGRVGRPGAGSDRPGGDRPDFAPGPSGGAPPAENRPAREPRRPPDDESPWLLVARHRGGSLDATTAAVRRRNLAVGLGVLGLLGTTAVILATGAQRARRLARQQLEFVAGVTHELNTPLAAIRSAGQNLADGIVTDPAHVRRYGGLIEKEGERLTALVSQVLDFAGIDSGSRAYASEPLSVATLVDDVLRDHRLVLEQAEIAVERDVAPGLPEITGDAAALRRTLANLVANAAKFAASGRSLSVRAALAPNGRAIELRVEDRGPGIPREERERVFEPFYRGAAAERNDMPGSGLGLSLVRHVVRAHGGLARVEGRPGGGATVVVELPVFVNGAEGAS